MSTDPTQPPAPAQPPTPAPEPVAPPVTPPAPAPAPEPPAPTVPADFDPARAMATIHAQREEERRLKAELAAAKEAADELARLKAALNPEPPAPPSPAEQQAHAELREARLLVQLARAEHHVIDPAAAAKLMTGVTFDEHQQPTNLADRITVLKEQSPYLFTAPAAAPTPPGINPGAGHQPAPAPTLTVDEARHVQEIGMDPAHYAALKELGTAGNQLEAWQKLQQARKAAGAA